MPETFQVLRCYKCEVFQVHPTKKANKWKCKVCNEKQSMKRFYSLGTGKECRLHVQKLNAVRGEIHATHSESDSSDPSSGSPEHAEQDEISPCSVAKKSKWLDFVDTEDNSITKEKQQIPDETKLNNCEIVLELPRKCSRRPLTERTKVVNNPIRESSSENYLQTSTLSNYYKKTNVIKSMDQNKSNLKSHMKDAVDVVESPIINDSKWAQFVDNSQDFKDENGTDPKTYIDSLSSLNPMFPFVEEEDDLDSLLDL